MSNLLRKLLQGFQNGWLGLLSFSAILILLWGTLAPVGTMVWWLDGGAEDFEERARRILFEDEPAAENATIPLCYIVFLTGVGDFSADELASGEEIFLDRLEQAQPDCVMVRDVFPYSAANQNIGGQEIFAFLWDIAEDADGWLEATRYLLQFRNLWRLAISADDRYGQVYNRAIALSIVEQMNQQNPVPPNADEPIQLILMGTSGGAQVGLAAVPYLNNWLNVDITVLSFGGVFDGQDGFDAADRVYHFRGEEDWVENIGGIVFPSRWAWTFRSPFNRARNEGRYIAIISGPHEHDGDRGYFGEAAIEGKEKTYLDLMFEQVMELPLWQEET
ncbi:hypothetical protein C7B76_23050 [filamentous cyanobacterium CCP2]|nr:hypothetical protein C7B76_23050 [filamentous cyanobacterium CCP2]